MERPLRPRFGERLVYLFAEMKAKPNYVPGLATVLVGDDTASSTYVRMKQRACEEAGIRSIGHNLPADTPQD